MGSKKQSKKVETVKSIEPVDMSELQSEIQRVFETVRDAVDAQVVGKSYKGQTVKKPTGRIVVSLDSLKGNSPKQTELGYFSSDSWKVEGETVDQVALNPHFLNRDSVDVVETLVHEYIHVVARVSDIKDTSRQGRYHNRAFSALVNMVDLLEQEENKTIGVVTSISERGRSWVAEEVQPNFGDVSKLIRAPKPTKPSQKVRVVCPDCQASATITKKNYDNGQEVACVNAFHESGDAFVIMMAKGVEGEEGEEGEN
jgi:hypothetical protein